MKNWLQNLFGNFLIVFRLKKVSCSGGQSNSALLRLMKAIEEQITNNSSSIPEYPTHTIETMSALASAIASAGWKMSDFTPKSEHTDCDIPQAVYPPMPEPH